MSQLLKASYHTYLSERVLAPFYYAAHNSFKRCPLRCC